MDCYYTKSVVLKKLATECNKFLTPDSTFVDFSCGTNEFVKYLHCKSISFDILPSENAVQKDWLSVRNGIPADSMIGINPPFGYRSAMAKRFITHAASFQPKYITVIIPTTKWIPAGYRLINQITLPHNSFYIFETNQEFSYPTTFYIFKRDFNETAMKKQISTFPEYLQVRCRVKQDDLYVKNWFVCVRRTGYYAGRQFYIGCDGETTYIHKNEMKQLDWTANNHSIENAFWVIISIRPISRKNMARFCCNFEMWIDTHARHFRENSHLISPSLTKGMIAEVIKQYPFPFTQ